MTVPSSTDTRTFFSSSTDTQPQVPRMPTTMVDVRMFRLSSSFSGSVTLK